MKKVVITMNMETTAAATGIRKAFMAIIMNMETIAAATGIMDIITIMQMRYSQAGAGRLPINIQTRSLTSC